MSVETFFSILSWVIVGGIAGSVASILLRAERNGCLLNVVIGVIGAFVGGALMSVLAQGGVTRIAWVNGIINATVGAVVVLIILEIVLPGRQLGVRDGKKRGKRKRRR